jgi:hypothetical protein
VAIASNAPSKFDPNVLVGNNCSIEEYVKEMMNEQNISMYLWGEAVMISIYV